MKTASFIKKLDSFTGDAALYLLSEPLVGYDGDSHDWVVVSATTVLEPETYIFPSDGDGKVTNWGELDGSYRGGLSHSEALEGAGYKVVGL